MGLSETYFLRVGPQGRLFTWLEACGVCYILAHLSAIGVVCRYQRHVLVLMARCAVRTLNYGMQLGLVTTRLAFVKLGPGRGLRYLRLSSRTEGVGVNYQALLVAVVMLLNLIPKCTRRPSSMGPAATVGCLALPVLPQAVDVCKRRCFVVGVDRCRRAGP